MSKGAGRNFYISKNSTKIAAVRVTTLTWAGNPIDVTSNDDSGITSYLTGVFATETMEMTVEGVADGDVLSDIAFGATYSARHMSDITLTRHNGDVISGNFILTNYQETGNYNEAVTFTATIVRNGAHTLTAA